MISTPARTIQYLAAASLLTVSIIDIFTPTEFVVDILYLSCIVIVFKQNARTIVSFSIAACLLIIINVLLFDFKLKFSLSLWINRGISIFAICITSYIAIHYQKLNQAATLKEKNYLKALEEMLFITSHQVRKPVANIIGLIDTMNVESTDLSPEDLRLRCRHLCSSAIELDIIIKELNKFIEQTERQSQA